MINVAKQIEYWRSSSENDIDTAALLISSGKFIEGMFFCHLSIEKIIKALVVKQSGNIPPRSHDLFYLAEISNLEVTEDISDFMQILMKYQLEGRYPEFNPGALSSEKTNDYLNQTKTLFQCFSRML